MNLTIKRETLLNTLQTAIGVVERRHTMQILANVLFSISANQLTIVGTDLEIELIGKTVLDTPTSDCQEIAIPARKLMDICKTLPDNSSLQIKETAKGKITISCGRSRFTLATMPAHDFPKMPMQSNSLQFTIKQELLKALAEKIYFTISQQDVRNYLNGLLLEINNEQIKAVASDGHRMAINIAEFTLGDNSSCQIIIPRKGVLELMRLLNEGDENAVISLNNNFIQVQTESFALTSKLITGKFPNYSKSFPKELDKQIILDRNQLKQSIQRVGILSNEIFRTVRFQLQDNLLQLFANNTEQEEAVEEIEIDYKWEPIEIIFNISYLLDILSNISSEKVIFHIKNSETGTIIEEYDNADLTKCTYILMPIRK